VLAGDAEDDLDAVRLERSDEGVRTRPDARFRGDGHAADGTRRRRDGGAATGRT